MAKLMHLVAVLLVLTCCNAVHAQQYRVHFLPSSGEADSLHAVLPDTGFAYKAAADAYLLALPAKLQSAGYLTASFDSLHYDTADVFVTVFLGQKYQWASLTADSSAQAILDALRLPVNTLNGNIEFERIRLLQQQMLDYLENLGHPFGKTWLDEVRISDGKVSAVLRLQPGYRYKIDSIRIYGDVKVSNEFLQRYLQIPAGSYYNKKRLQNISKKLAELSFIEEERPSDLTLLATGSILNLYLKNRRTSQVNALVGFLPNSDALSPGKKFLLTVDANILLRNSLGSGETIGVVWQQLQQQSPRLNLLYEQPYVFHSPFGIGFSFDLYKRDSTFLNLNMNLGTTYHIEEKKTATIFLQRRQTIVSAVNVAQVLLTRKLPQEADVSSLNLGVGYNFVNTDYKFNPRKGNELALSATGGSKNIRKNNEVVNIKDPGDPGFKFSRLYDTVKLKAYQARATATAAHFVPLGTQSTIKFGVSSGIYQSANYFRNEMFQIGGYKLLRGFDEESQFVNRYAIATAEYRYRLSLNSYFFAFLDGGFGHHQLETIKDHNYFGTGLGLSFETKAGVINLAWAVGKRDDTELNLRQSKVHLGFVSYF